MRRAAALLVLVACAGLALAQGEPEAVYVTGRVLRASGAPADGVLVEAGRRLRGPARRAERAVFADPDGAFRLGPLATASAIEVEAREGWTTSGVRVVDGSRAGRVALGTLALERSADEADAERTPSLIRGRVVSSAGAPAGGARVFRLDGRGRERGDVARARPDGTFAIPAGQEPWIVGASLREESVRGAERGAAEVGVDERGRFVEVEVRLAPVHAAVPVRGSVVGPDGAPAPGAWIYLESPLAPTRGAAAPSITERAGPPSLSPAADLLRIPGSLLADLLAGPGGSFEAEGIRGEVRVAALGPPSQAAPYGLWGEARCALWPGRPARLDVRLAPLGAIEGRVALAGGVKEPPVHVERAGVPGGQRILWPGDPRYRDGRFTLEGLPAGEYSLGATPGEAYDAVEFEGARVLVREGLPSAVTITCIPPRPVVVRVVDPLGERGFALDGVRVDESGFSIARWPDPAPPQPAGAREGPAALRLALARRSFRITAMARSPGGLRLEWRREVDVAALEGDEVPLEVRPRGSLRLRFPEGTRRALGVIELERAEGDRDRVELTIDPRALPGGEDPPPVIAGIPEGVYAASSDAGLSEREVTVLEGRETVLDVRP